MRKPVVIMMLLVLLLGFFSPTVFANPDAQSKKLFAVLPAINNSGLKGSNYLNDLVNESLNQKFGSSERYIVLTGSSLVEGLRREGIENFRTADPAALHAALRNMNVDYCLRTEVQYIATEQRIKLPSVLLLIKTWYATVPLHFTVTDINHGVVYSDIVISDHGQHDSIVGFAKQKKAVTDALEKVLDRFDREVALP